ncbi:LOW QUALITY PROTEIN: MDGA2 isoform 9, partial [Pongo abelii]
MFKYESLGICRRTHGSAACFSHSADSPEVAFCQAKLPFLAPTTVTSDPPTVRIVHSGLACNIEEERYSERVYTIREGETLELTCLVTGHPRPQIRWTKTAGSASDRFQDSSVFNETLRITNIQRHQGGRYYCKAENGLGS